MVPTISLPFSATAPEHHLFPGVQALKMSDTVNAARLILHFASLYPVSTEM